MQKVQIHTLREQFLGAAVCATQKYNLENFFDIARNHYVSIQKYKDKTKLYVSFDASDNVPNCLKKMEELVGELC